VSFRTGFALRARLGWRRLRTNPTLHEALGCLLIALVVVSATLDLKILNPVFIDWCLNWAGHDISNYYLSFAYYRHSSWTFPNITQIDTLFHPIGATVVLMDGLPLLSVPLKLVQRLLPERFQFLGLWLLACHSLQAFVGLRVLKRFEVSPALAWCGAILLTAAPPLIMRHEHTQLCAHFLVIASLYAALSPRPTWLLVVLPTLALWIHAYWVVICFPFLALGQLRFLRTRGDWLRVLLTAIPLGLSLWLLGYLNMSKTDASGFGVYVSDLSTFYNPMGFSAFLPNLPVARRAYEGFAYLGLAGFVLVLPCLLGIVLPTPRVSRATLACVVALCIVLGLFAVSPVPQFQGRQVAEFKELYSLLEPIGTRFRSTGRFIWPLYYLILLFGLKGLQGLLRSRLASWSCAVALVALQVADLGPAYLRMGRDAALTEDTDWQVPAEVQAQLTADSRFLVFWPPVKVDCGGKIWRRNYFAYALFGAEHGLTTNSDFGQARLAPEDARRVCRWSKRIRDEAAERPEVIVVTKSR
jgi:hypothetical protein